MDASIAAPKPTAAVEDIIASKEYFRVTSWHQVNTPEIWSELSEEIGKGLRWWNVATAMVKLSAPEIPAEYERKGIKTVWIFISSTPGDLICERDFIVSEIIPRLSQWCAERKLHVKLQVVDLRLRSFSDRSLEACLNQVRRCRQENTMVYFIGLLGDRYGYVPKDNEIPIDVCRDYCFIPGMSITALEMFTGAVWDRNPNAIFMMRDSAVIDSVRNVEGVDFDAVVSDYREAKSGLRQSLTKLKQLIRETLPEQTFDYTCTVEGVTTDEAGKARLELRELEQQFGVPILSHLQRQIAAQYPTPVVSPTHESAMDKERRLHLEFVKQRCEPLLARDNEKRRIRDYILRAVLPDSTVPIMILSGPEGVGLSSIIANVVNDMRNEERWPAIKTVVHFVGVSSASSRLPSLLKRLWVECLETDADIPSNVMQLRRSFMDASCVLAGASKLVKNRGLSRLVILIDAVDKLDDQFEQLHPAWLPSAVPYNVRLIVSAVGNRRLVAPGKQPLEVHVEPLDQLACVSMLTPTLDRCNRTLTEGEQQSLLAKRDVGLPLWLALSAEEARFCSREAFELQPDLPSLVGQIVRRITEKGKGKLNNWTAAALCLLCTSHFGLTELELREMLAASTQGSSKKTRKSSAKVADDCWAMVYLDLQPLVTCFDPESGRLNFRNRILAQVVARELLQDKETQVYWHARASDYFENCADCSRRAVELTHHLEAVGEFSRLRKTLLDYDLFCYLTSGSDILDFLTLWKNLALPHQALNACENALRNDWLVAWFPTELEKIRSGDIYQWPVKVLASSASKSRDTGAATNLLGSRSVHPLYGSNAALTWQPNMNVNSKAVYVELEYETAVYATAVCIYETCAAGAVRCISVRNAAGNWLTVYSTQSVDVYHRSRIFRPKIRRPKFKTNAVRVELDTSAAALEDTNVEIDAIALVGYLERRGRGSSRLSTSRQSESSDAFELTSERTPNLLLRQFVHQVTGFSAQFECKFYETYSAKQLCGKPTVYPRCQLNRDAWFFGNTLSRESVCEYVEVEFEHAVYVAAIEIFETFNAGGGGVRQVALRNPQGDWQAVFCADADADAECLASPRRFVPAIERPKWKTKAIRIELDRVQLDAVALFGHQDRAENDAAPLATVQRYYETEPLYDDEADDDEVRLLRGLNEHERLRWLHAATLVARFAAQLDDVICVVAGQTPQIFSANCERFANWCFETSSQVFGLELSQLVAASSRYQVQHVDRCIEIMECSADKSGLEELYCKKGELLLCNDADAELSRKYFEKACQIAESLFGRLHHRTARVYQLFATSMCFLSALNKSSSENENGLGTDIQVPALRLALRNRKTQLQILQKIYGHEHLSALEATHAVDSLRYSCVIKSWQVNALANNAQSAAKERRRPSF